MIDREVPEKTIGRSLTMNAAARFAAEGVMLVVSQIVAIVICRSLGATGKGLASLLLIIAAVTLMVVDLGMIASGVFFVGRRRYSVQNIVGAFLAAGLIIGFAVAGVMVLIRNPLSTLLFNGEHANLILLMAIGLPVGLLFNWLGGVLRGQERIVEVSVVNALSPIFGLIVLVVGLFVLDLGAASIVWNANAIAAFGLVSFVWLLKRQGVRLVPRLDWEILKSSVNYGLRGQVGQILQFINYRFDLFVVNYFLGMGSVGIYGVGAGVAQVIWQIPNSLSYALYSRVSSIERDEGNTVTLRIARQSMLLTLASAIVLVPAGYIGIPLLFGDDFRGAIMPMWLLLPGVVALSYYKTLAVHLAGQGHPEYYSYGAGVSAVVTLVLDFALIPRYGINGAAIASSVAYVINAVICIYWFLMMTDAANLSKLFVPQREDFAACRRLAARMHNIKHKKSDGRAP